MSAQSSLPSGMAYFYQTRKSTIQRSFFLSCFILLAALFFLYQTEVFQIRSSPEISAVNPTPTLTGPNDGIKTPLIRGSNDVALVAPKTRDENVRWMATFCKQFGCTPYIYTTDEIPEEDYLHPRTLKGHEAAAYLTYIVDHYDHLSPFTIFIHGKDEHWHNDAAGPKTSNVLLNLRFEAARAYGYVNLRCLAVPGCPDSLHPAVNQKTDLEYHQLVEDFPQIYYELFGESDAPSQVGHQCCGQFIVTRDRIRQRPRSDYERLLHWVGNTTRTDSYGIGWTLEKLWHIIFGMNAVHCPPVEQCRCDVYGWCGPNPSTSNEVLIPIR
ncbi:hypothetical protein BDV28DRAFT_135553 [Aspergillus coremiiformis]|uniref:DUF3431 domain containing protein n=1 Tax=Aspergillus coremiiformis TaxID=138285 RepID=A0A5N6Z5R2_9EURO|nr:hypothetical protein BDV28DRAFT_135553 [Aspergillus coremiiformis]